MLLEVEVEGLDIFEWARECHEDIDRLIRDSGALLIRGLTFSGVRDFGKVLSILFNDDLLNYTYRSTPRTELENRVYTATEYYSDQTIPQHNENSYFNSWPMRIGFMCIKPAENGGETPICDSREVYSKIPNRIRSKFEEKGVMYIRNYSDIDLPWKDVFQTEKKNEVEAFCKYNKIDFEWIGDEHLKTKQVNQASAEHPVSGDKIWFNQAHLFHISNLEKEIRETLLLLKKESELPRSACYGDGSFIDSNDLDEIRMIYKQNLISFMWKENDILLLDNMHFSHGREPYTGERQVVVGMGCAKNSNVIMTSPRLL
ncbi:hypothetical protein GL2_37080 [Microbulbifer sp. GL-2]|nr:hypothetical protein GL2_37080 [Microbulbifer sp. GL-2]